MTETTDQAAEPTPEAWQALADATRAAIDSEQSDDDPGQAMDDTASVDDDRSQSRREARYRTQLREAEAERDTLRANVEALQRAEVERLAGKSIHKPSALWSADIKLADLLDDAGTVDDTKVAAAVQTARDTLGLAATRPPGYVGSEGRVIETSTSSNPWVDAFKG